MKPLTHAAKKIHARPVLAEPVIVGSFWRNRRGESIRVSLSTYENHNLLDVRQCFTANDGRTQGTKKGICVSILRLPELITVLRRAERRAIDLGLLPSGEAVS